MLALIPIFALATFGILVFSFNLLAKTKMFSFLNTKETLIDLLYELTIKERMEEFNPVSTNEGKRVYHFEEKAKDTYLFELTSDANSIILNVKNKRIDKIQAHFTFDKRKNTFLSKNISSDVLKKGKKDLDIFEKFVKKMIDFDWNSNTSIEISNDSIVPKSFDFGDEKLTSLQEMKSLIDKEKDNEVLSTFRLVIGQVEELFSEIDNHDFDFETKHMVNRLLTEDLSNLFYPYLNLNKEEKELYQEKILLGLQKIEERVNTALGKIKTNHSHEVEKALQLIQKRY